MLAIVIPYYKYDFFEETLQSLAMQANKQFHVYIGDDGSPKPPTDLLEKYKNQFSFSYHRFETNLGGTSLVQHWNRCLQMVQKETWVQILGDDDTLAPNVIASFYENLPEIIKVNSTVVRLATQVIDKNGIPISEIYEHPKLELATDFLIRKFKGGTRSSLSEYIFEKRSLNKIGFKEFPLAWYSDLLAVMECTKYQPIYTIQNSLIYFRLSKLNITAQTNNKLIKERAYQDFLFYAFHKFNSNRNLKVLLIKLLEKAILNDKKNFKRVLYLIFLLIKSLKIKLAFEFLIKYFKAVVR
jgi:hypothetical protein